MFSSSISCVDRRRRCWTLARSAKRTWSWQKRWRCWASTCRRRRNKCRDKQPNTSNSKSKFVHFNRFYSIFIRKIHVLVISFVYSRTNVKQLLPIRICRVKLLCVWWRWRASVTLSVARPRPSFACTWFFRLFLTRIFTPTTNYWRNCIVRVF